MSDSYQSDVRPARLVASEYAQRFADATPRLTRTQALLEAERCLYCYDAPCATACPTSIDVPSFIKRIADDNLRGSARTILESNPLGGMCARVCPTGALDLRTAGKSEMDGSYLSVAVQKTTVGDNCVHCGLCAEVCPQSCIEIQDRHLAEDGRLKVEGKTLIDLNRCIHCGWCAAVCPVGAISFGKPFAGEFSRDDKVCQACRTCVHTCPANALFNKEAGPGEMVEKVTHRKEACIYCGACALACPVAAIKVTKTAIVTEMKGKKALEKKVARGLVCEIALPEGATLEAGEPREERGQLEGRAYKHAFMSADDETNDRVKVEWVVRAPQRGVVKVVARHIRAGTVRAEVEL